MSIICIFDKWNSGKKHRVQSYYNLASNRRKNPKLNKFLQYQIQLENLIYYIKTYKLQCRCCKTHRYDQDKQGGRNSTGTGPWVLRQHSRGPTEAHQQSTQTQLRYKLQVKLPPWWSPPLTFYHLVSSSHLLQQLVCSKEGSIPLGRCCCYHCYCPFSWWDFFSRFDFGRERSKF